MDQPDAARRGWRVACVLWLVVLTVATHWQRLELGNEQHDSPDKVLHFACFGILAFSFWCGGWVRRPIAAVLLVLAWTVLDEWTQHLLPNDRGFSVADLLAGQLGVICAGCWFGSMRATPALRDGLEAALAARRNWLVLAVAAIVTTAAISALTWAMAWFAFSVSPVEEAVAIGLTVAAAATLRIAAGLGGVAPLLWAPALIALRTAAIPVAVIAGACWWGASTLDVLAAVVALAGTTLALRAGWQRGIRAGMPAGPMD